MVLAVGGFLCWTRAMALTSDTKPEEAVPHAAVGFVCIGCVFGIVAGPFTNYGAYPWYWTSRWDWAPIVAFVPNIMIVRDLISGAVVARRKRKAKENGRSTQGTI